MMMTRRSLNINHKISAGAGFTLLELMVAVAIIVLLTVLSIPRFSALKDNLDASAARNTLSAALAQARNLAIRGDLGDIAVVFFYDRDNERYTMLTARLRAKGLPNPNDLGSPYD
ncbi:MAG TPA: prepilin-type N-terminal cleavage/methylation domain-containing protein, partial [Phycisphaeraceae bacterium]|nr:prepilin-type N-terminal cleavage/methylation domain-containing protein [Phycisphaeraceae bacterium]